MDEITKDEIDIWKQRIDVAKKYTEPEHKLARHWIEWYMGNQYTEPEGQQQTDVDKKTKIVVNLAFPTIQETLVSIYFKNPTITAAPMREEDIDSAPIFEKAVNYTIREMEMKPDMEQVVLDGLTWKGLVKLGYDYDDIEELKGDERIPIDDLTKPITKHGKVVAHEPLKDDEGNVQYKKTILTDVPTLEVVNPLLFFQEPDTTKLSKAGWCFEVITKSLDEVKQNPNFSNTDDLEATKTIPNELKELEKDSKDKVVEHDDYKRVEYYQIWIKDTWIGGKRIVKKLLVLADGHDQQLRYEDWPLPLEDYPYEELIFNRKPTGAEREEFPIAELAIWEDQQIAINFLSNFEYEEIDRLAHKKILVDEDSLGEGGEDAIKEPSSGIMIPVKAGVRDPRQLQVGGVSSSALNARSIQQMFQREISGVGQAQRGRSTGHTLGEAQIVEYHTRLRGDKKRSAVEDFARNVFRKLGQIIKEFYDQKRVMKITGPEGAKWISWSKEDIQGEYDVDVIPGSAIKPDKAILRSVWLQAYQLLRGDPGIDQRDLKKRLLESFEVKDIEDLLIGKDFVHPARENLMLANGEWVEPKEDENQAEHLAEHTMFVKSPIYRVVEDEAKQLMQEHIDRTGLLIQARADAVAGEPGGREPKGLPGAQPGMVKAGSAASGVEAGPRGQGGPGGAEEEIGGGV